MINTKIEPVAARLVFGAAILEVGECIPWQYVPPAGIAGVIQVEIIIQITGVHFCFFLPDIAVVNSAGDGTCYPLAIIDSRNG